MNHLEIIIIHGLNNSSEAFFPLGKELESQGFTIRYFNLIGHEELNSNISMEESIKHLQDQFESLPHDKKYYCIAFSQGGLVLQLISQSSKKNLVKQILLSPALKIRKNILYRLILPLIPRSWRIKSNTPLEVRKFNELSLNYYQNLVDQVQHLKGVNRDLLDQISTFTIIDPNDELVDYKELESFIKLQKLTNWKFELFHRKNKPSRHHELFHPMFLDQSDWSLLITNIVNFIKS